MTYQETSRDAFESVKPKIRGIMRDVLGHIWERRPLYL